MGIVGIILGMGLGIASLSLISYLVMPLLNAIVPGIALIVQILFIILGALIGFKYLSRLIPL